MTTSGGKPTLRAPGQGDRITRNEIFEILADEGYSAGDRKAWLRQVLTQLAGPSHNASDPDREALVEEIKTILDRQVPGKPEADDTL